MRCVALPVTEENFEILGQVIKTPDVAVREPQLKGDGFYHHAELAFMDTHGPVEWGITTFSKRPMITETLEQHFGTPEMLLALDGPFVMPVAPKMLRDGKEVPDESKIFAIYVPQGVGVLFDEGQYQWAPFPLQEKSSVLVGFQPKTWEDNIVIRQLSEPVEIVLPVEANTDAEQGVI